YALTWVSLLVIPATQTRADLGPGGGGLRARMEAEYRQRSREMFGYDLGSAPVVIEFDDAARQTRMLVPRKLLAELRASADTPDNHGVASWLSGPTMVAGVALAFSLAFSGLWLVRSHGTSRLRYFVVVVPAVIVAGMASTLLWAEPPRTAPTRPQF